MFLGQQVINLERILAGVRESRLGPDPVRRTLPEAGRGQRVSIEQRPAIRADAAQRNDVVRERLAGREIARRRAIVGVSHYGAPAQELIGRIEQLTQVAVTHRYGGYCPGGRVLLPPVYPFLGKEEE